MKKKLKSNCFSLKNILTLFQIQVYSIYILYIKYNYNNTNKWIYSFVTQVQCFYTYNIELLIVCFPWITSENKYINEYNILFLLNYLEINCLIY